jgi:hypothetical protein
MRAQFLLLMLSGACSFPLNRPIRSPIPRPQLATADEGSNADEQIDEESVTSEMLDIPDPETAKMQLESLFRLRTENETESASSNIPALPRMSGTKRRRIEREKVLIGMLAGEQAEQAIGLLWKHWFNERGETARLQMEEVENLMGGSGLDPQALEQAASKLDKLIEAHEDWAEPMNRLAMVRFLQQRWSDSVMLCEKVIVIKPWHFGALSGLIMCHQRRGNIEAAQEYVTRNIPPPGPQRKKWVEKMVREIDIRQKFIL